MQENLKQIVEEEIELDNEKDIDEPDDLSGNRKIYTDQGDPEVDSLHRRFKKGRLNVQPLFQREFVWDKVKSSRLIESALLDIPIPIVYLSEAKDGTENVIDGQQRLTSFFSFIDGKLPDNTEFKLAGLKVFTELNGKKFNQLSEELQDKIISYKIRVIKFKRESDGDLQFEIFARLNTGSVPLNDQELRNCVFRGRFNELLKELSQDKDFKYLLGIASPDRRMKDRELVLRFASFYLNTYLNYNAPIKKFLNDTMEKYQNISETDEMKLRNAFKNSISIIRTLLDNNAFKRFYRGDERNINGKWEAQKFNVSLYDILMYSFVREDKNLVIQNLDRIRESFINLMTGDQDFIDSIELSTSSKKAVTIRFDKWRLALQEIIGIGFKEPRCFTYSLKKELFEKNDTCTICGNIIRNIDDAAVDHINQYWTGGKTIPENARLTHRYCNNARPRNEDNILKTDINASLTDLLFSEPDSMEENEPKAPIYNKEKTKDFSGNEIKRYEFFNQFLTLCNKKTNLFKKISPVGYQSWINAGSGTSGISWLIVANNKSAHVDLYFGSPNSDINRTRFEYFASKKQEIEEKFGEPLIWDFNDNRKQQYIRSICPIGNFEDEEKWPEIQNDLVDRLIRLENILKPYFFSIKNLNVYEGIIDSENNPFIRQSWVEQGLALTPMRQGQLPELFGKTEQNILMINPENDGRYIAFISIRWGFAVIMGGKLTPTEKWTNRFQYDGHGHPLKKI
jgi:hypothetical protein